MPDRPIGLFVTLSAYGNRLHGDERGTVDRWNNSFGEPTLPPGDARRQYETRVQKYPSMKFDAVARSIVEAAVAEAAEFRGWLLAAHQCRTNHLHVVVGTTDERTKVISQLKTRTTLALRRAGRVAREQPVWARGASGRYLWTERDVEAASEYTMESQGAALPGTGFWRDMV